MSDRRELFRRPGAGSVSSRSTPRRSWGWAQILCVSILAATLAACGGGGGNGRTVDTTDTTPPSKLTMDAHVPQPNGQAMIITVTPTSGDKSTTLASLPVITLIASAEDQESAIADLTINGETAVSCVGTELGQNQNATWVKKAPQTTQPQFSRLVSLNVPLGRQNPTDRPGVDFIAHCPSNMRLTAVSGDFSASATNGAGKNVTTGTFSFRWRRP